MAHHFLQGENVAAASQEHNGKGMAQVIGTDPMAQFFAVLLHYLCPCVNSQGLPGKGAKDG